MRVTIDPGDGSYENDWLGHDPRTGYCSYNQFTRLKDGKFYPPEREERLAAGLVTEGHLNWLLAQKLIEILMGQGHTVNCTKQAENQDPDPYCRAVSAKNSHCLVSIHHNVCSSSLTAGFDILIHELGGDLACLILEEVKPCLYNWGIRARDPAIKVDTDYARYGRLSTLADCPVPSCMIKACFISNPLEMLAALQPTFRQHIAGAIAHGIGRFGKEVLNLQEVKYYDRRKADRRRAAADHC